MPKARSTDFTEEFRMLDGKGVKEERIEAVEASGNQVPPLDYDTTIQHLRRNGYEVNPSPNGGSLDVGANDDIKAFDISVLQDDAAQVEFSMDINEAERRRGDEIANPEAYVEKVYGQIVGELVEREKKLERASENYVSNLFDTSKTPIEDLEDDFNRHGDSADEIVDSYFGDMRPTELAMNYAVQFELHEGETVDNERRNLKGKMPVYDAMKDSDARDRDALYFQRFLGKVLEKADEREHLSDELRDYWQDLP